MNQKDYDGYVYTIGVEQSQKQKELEETMGLIPRDDISVVQSKREKKHVLTMSPAELSRRTASPMEPSFLCPSLWTYPRPRSTTLL